MLRSVKSSLGRVRPLLQRSLFFRVLDARRGGLHSPEIGLVLTDRRGVRFVLPAEDQSPVRAMLLRGEDQPQLDAMAALVRQGDTVFDVGAHLGFITVAASRLVGPAGRVYAFEPVPESYWRLREALALNRCENVTPVQAAVSDRAGIASMSLFGPTQSAWNTLSASPRMETLDGRAVPPKSSVEVRVDTLDLFAAEHGIDRIDFLKIDVEGYEKAAFQGAERLLRDRRIGALCFEISQLPLEAAGVTAREVFAVLEGYGYRSYRYRADTKAFEGPVSDSAEHFANFYASHTDLTAQTPE